jgi:hypothetical protein
VRLVRSLSRERCPPNIYIFSGLKHARLLAPDGLELAMTGCSGAVIFGHLKALALDHLGGPLDHNDVAVFMWLPPFRAAFSAPGRDGEANRPRCSPRYQRFESALPRYRLFCRLRDTRLYVLPSSPLEKLSAEIAVARPFLPSNACSLR